MLQGSSTWFSELIGPGLLQLSSVKAVYYQGNTQYQRVEVLEMGDFGRCLILDGKTQSAEADEFVYHESLVHPALLAHPNPRRVFIAGGGEGATLREVLAHKSVQEAVMVDIDREVVELCQKYLPLHHQGAFDDPRARLLFQDANVYLEQNPEPFDAIVLDLPDPIEGGPAAMLYTQRFFQLVRQRLSPGGLMVVQSGSCGPTNYKDVFPAIHNTLETVFPAVRSYGVTVASFGSPWGFTVGSLGPDPAPLTPAEVDRRLAARITRPLRLYDGVTHQHLFALPKYLRQALEAEQRVITEATPVFVV